MSSGSPSECSSEGSPPSTGSPVAQYIRRLQRLQERESALREPSFLQNRRLQGQVQGRASARGSERRSEMLARDLEALINYLNTPQSIEGILQILPVAVRCNMPNFANRLSLHLVNSLTVFNCIPFYRLSRRLSLSRLRTASLNVLLKNFITISETDPAFTHLSCSQLTAVIFSDSLYATEEQIFRAIVRWVKAARVRREYYIDQLLPAVRVNRCSLTFLEEMAEHSLVQGEPNFWRVVQDRIRWLTSGRYDRALPAADASSRAGDRNIIFVMGGLENVSTIETLDPARGTWVSHNIPEAPRDNNTWICSMGHKILVLEELGCRWRFRSFDVPTMKWTMLKRPLYYRRGSCKANFDHNVYILGGENPWKSECVEYDSRTNNWKEMTRMNERRNGAAACCFEGKLYCCGGADKDRNESFNGMEVFDLRGTAFWNYLPGMQIPRVEHKLVPCRRYLWVIGGIYDEVCVSAVERYDVDAQQWSFFLSFVNIREFPSVCSFDNYIYVTGGKFAENVPDSKVDILNEEDGEWMDGVPLNSRRCFHGSCVVQYLSDTDADQYAVPLE